MTPASQTNEDKDDDDNDVIIYGCSIYSVVYIKQYIAPAVQGNDSSYNS